MTAMSDNINRKVVCPLTDCPDCDKKVEPHLLNDGRFLCPWCQYSWRPVHDKYAGKSEHEVRGWKPK